MLDETNLLQRLGAEVIGTAFLVFIGVGSVPATLMLLGNHQFTMAELATAVQFKLSVPIIIFDDSTYSAVKDAQSLSRDGRFMAVDLVNPDFIKLADAYGVPSARPETPEALEFEIRAALERSGPTIINAPIRGWV